MYGGRYKNALVVAIVVPFFASYLIRTYAWSALLSNAGLVNGGLRRTHPGHGIHLLNTPWAVIGGLVYGFGVLLPVRHGALSTFVHVTLPATRAGWRTHSSRPGPG